MSLDADQQFLVEDGEDALKHGDRGDVVAALELGDERVGRLGALSYVLLGELQLVAALADVRGDPVPVTQLSDGRVLVTCLAIIILTRGPTLCRSAGRGAGRAAAGTTPVSFSKACRSTMRLSERW